VKRSFADFKNLECLRLFRALMVAFGCLYLLAPPFAHAAKKKPPTKTSKAAEEKKRKEAAEQAKRDALADEERRKAREKAEAESDAAAAKEAQRKAEGQAAVQNKDGESKEVGEASKTSDEAKAAGEKSEGKDTDKKDADRKDTGADKDGDKARSTDKNADAKPGDGDDPKAAAPPKGASPTDGGRAIGFGYRLTVLPAFVIRLAAQTEDTLLFHTATVSYELRSGNFTAAPTLGFTSFVTGELLVGLKGSPYAASFINAKSTMFGVSVGATLRWSFPISRRLEFEFGTELGAGIAFGNLKVNWVSESSNGPLSNGTKRYTPCTEQLRPGCRPQDHPSTKLPKVGNFSEPSQLVGGKAPSFFPLITFPLVGLRLHTGEKFSTAIYAGASATGFWFGLSGSYRTARD
jgi:hypothetical protein